MLGRNDDDVIVRSIITCHTLDLFLQIRRSDSLHGILDADGLSSRKVGNVSHIQFAQHIVLLLQRQRQRLRFVSILLHLADIPPHLQIAEVGHTVIVADSLHLLIVPEREDIVITIGYDDRIRRKRQKIIGTEVDASVTARTVVVVPVLRRHKGRDAQTEQRGSRGSDTLVNNAFQPRSDIKHAQANPYTEGIERARISIITLTRLIWRLIKINDNGQASQQEQNKGEPETLHSLFLTGKLVKNTKDTQQERQEIVSIVRTVVLQLGRQIALIAQHGIVDERNTAAPVAMSHFSIALDIVLTTHEVPHKVTPVHETDLILQEENKVLTKSRIDGRIDLTHIGVTDVVSLDVGPLLIGCNMVGLLAIHTRERHQELFAVVVLLLVIVKYVMVVLFRRLLDG